jgi:hypothetical protein
MSGSNTWPRIAPISVSSTAAVQPVGPIQSPSFTKSELRQRFWHPDECLGAENGKECAEIIVRMALFGTDGPTGGYFDANGALPW